MIKCSESSVSSSVVNTFCPPQSFVGMLPSNLIVQSAERNVILLSHHYYIMIFCIIDSLKKSFFGIVFKIPATRLAFIIARQTGENIMSWLLDSIKKKEKAMKIWLTFFLGDWNHFLIFICFEGLKILEQHCNMVPAVHLDSITIHFMGHPVN